MRKKIVSMILSLCIIVCALPMNIFAAPEQNETLTFNGGKTLLLQNDYISFYLYKRQNLYGNGSEGNRKGNRRGFYTGYSSPRLPT